jgi:uncharacterized protein YkwD
MYAGRYFLRFRIFILVGVLLTSIFIASILFSDSVASGETSYTPKTEVMKQIVAETNELRRQNGLKPLQPDASLEKSAYAKLSDMRSATYWGHYAPDGTSFSAFIWQENDAATSVGENLARCYATYDAAFTGLVNSPKHFAVLTGDFTYIGVASEITANGCESIVMHVSN